MYCSRRLYKGNEYEICLPIKESGVTQVNFYTDGEIKVEKEPVETTGDTMCFDFSVEDLDVLADGVLRYEVVTEYETTDTNAPFVVVTPAAYSAKTLDELLEEAYESGYTAGQEDCSGYTQEDLDAAYASGYTKGYQDGFDDCHGPEPVYSAMPLTFEIISGGTIKWTYVISTSWGEPIGPKTIEYQINDGEWTEITSSTAGTSFNVNEGDVVKFRGNNNGYASGGASFSYNVFSGSTAVFNLKGNLLSLNSKTNYTGRTSINSSWAFYGLFQGTNVVDASNLVLPATSITLACYEYLFGYCAMLIHPPKVLPAPTIYGLSYWGMFFGCTNMVEAPEILATSIDSVNEGSLSYMFKDCRSLTKAPDIIISTLYREQCGEMFAGCTNLNYIKCLATKIEPGACPGWLNGVSETGTFIKHPESTGWVASYIPSGWTVIDADI